MFLFNLVLILLMILFPSVIASAFTSDEKLIETVVQVMPVFLAGMTIFGLQRACQNMFVALGQAKVSIFIALLRKVILLIPPGPYASIPDGSDGGICCRSNIGCCGSHLLYSHLCGSVPKDHE